MRLRKWVRIPPLPLENDMKKASEMTVTELLRELTYWEDTDTYLIIFANRDGGISVTEYDSSNIYDGDTVEEAIINMAKSYPNLDDENVDWRS